MFKQNRENLEKLDALENEGMINSMHFDLRMFRMTKFTGCSSFYQWQRWIRF